MHTHRHGHHFVPDAKVADYVQGPGAKSERSIIFARVTCGGMVINSTHEPTHMHVRIVCSAVSVKTIVAHSDPTNKKHLAGTATRDLLSGSKDLAKIENRIPPPGFQSATSQQVRTEHNPWHARTFANTRKRRPPCLMTIEVRFSGVAASSGELGRARRHRAKTFSQHAARMTRVFHSKRLCLLR